LFRKSDRAVTERRLVLVEGFNLATRNLQLTSARSEPLILLSPGAVSKLTPLRDALAHIDRSSSSSSSLRSAEFLGESDEKAFRPADVAEPIRVFILDYIAYELRAALAEPVKRLVDVVHGEHDAEVA
jgi:hypothetical protein